MKSVSGELFTGRKAIRLADLPEEAWTVIAGDGAGQGEAASLYAAVSWLYRCVDARAGAVANMPWEIRRGKEVIMTPDGTAPERMAWLADLPGLLYRTEAAVTLTGRAYWFRERNLLRTLAVRWLRPDSVRPEIDRDGLRGFTRFIGGQGMELTVDDLVYFWLPDPFVELGPAEHYPGKAAMAAAGALRSMETFLTGYFDRGLIKATLLKYTTPVSVEEGKRVKEWWRRVAQGVKNAFATEIIRGDFEPMVIGEGLKDLQNTALTSEQRESICTALGVPQSKVTANAANYATANQDALSFVQDTIAPECRWLAAEINRQLLGPMGLTFVFLPETLSIMQEDETARADSLGKIIAALTAGGMEPEIALEAAVGILGYELPEGVELPKPPAPAPPPPQLLPFTGQQQPEQVAVGAAGNGERIDEVRRFQRWARKRSDPDPAQFESVILSAGDKELLLSDLRGDGDADDAPFQGGHDWDNYP